MKTAYYTVVLLLGAVALSAGSIIVYEPYPIGTSPTGYKAGESLISTNNVGVNASAGAWTGNTTGATAFVVSGTGLTYSGLQTSGGAIDSSVTNVSNLRPFSGSDITASTYYSFLINFANFNSAGVLISLSNSANGFVSGVRIDATSGGSLFVQSNNSIGASVALASSQTYLIVGKWTPGVSDTTQLWVNPVVGDPEPGATLSHAAGVGAGVAKWNTYMNPTGGLSNYTFDEFRVGTTWASVTPVPEPGSLALILAAGAGFLFRRSRPRC